MAEPILANKIRESRVTILNRSLITITGLDKVFSSNETTVFGAAGGSNFQVTGTTLTVTKIDLDGGVLEVSGKVEGFKYIGAYKPKTSFFKKG